LPAEADALDEIGAAAPTLPLKTCPALGAEAGGVGILTPAPRTVHGDLS